MEYRGSSCPAQTCRESAEQGARTETACSVCSVLSCSNAVTSRDVAACPMVSRTQANPSFAIRRRPSRSLAMTTLQAVAADQGDLCGTMSPSGWESVPTKCVRANGRAVGPKNEFVSIKPSPLGSPYHTSHSGRLPLLAVLSLPVIWTAGTGLRMMDLPVFARPSGKQLHPGM